MNTVGIGFAGVGFMGQGAHLRKYANRQDCRVIAIAVRRSLGSGMNRARVCIGRGPSIMPQRQAAIRSHALRHLRRLAAAANASARPARTRPG